MNQYRLTFVNSVIEWKNIVQSQGDETMYSYHHEVVEADSVTIDSGMWNFYVGSTLTYSVPLTLAVIEPVGEQIPNFSFVPTSTNAPVIATPSDPNRQEYNFLLAFMFKLKVMSGKLLQIPRTEVVYAEEVHHRDSVYLTYDNSVLKYGISSSLCAIDFRKPLSNFFLHSTIASQGPQGPQGFQGPQGPSGSTASGGTGGTGSTAGGSFPFTEGLGTGTIGGSGLTPG